MVRVSRLHSDKNRRLTENGEFLNKGGKPFD